MPDIRFAPQLFIPGGTRDISFYGNALGAVELRRFTNDDDTIHVAEFSIGGAIYQLHESRPDAGQLHPSVAGGTTVLVGLFVDDVDAVVDRAVSAGAELVSEPTTYDYGYRQAKIRDPFGHIWMIEEEV